LENLFRLRYITMNQNQYGKVIENILTSFVNKTVPVYEPTFLQENDYFVRFMGFQRQMYIGLSEEMKTKIVLSVNNTSKIITDSNKQSLAKCRKLITEMNESMVERQKQVKQ
jgi:hypothetical protein